MGAGIGIGIDLTFMYQLSTSPFFTQCAIEGVILSQINLKTTTCRWQLSYQSKITLTTSRSMARPAFRASARCASYGFVRLVQMPDSTSASLRTIQPIHSRLPHETSPSINRRISTTSMSKRKTDTMPGEPAKRQKREEYKKTLIENDAALPKKKFYRQRAHANPFSDHSLT